MPNSTVNLIDLNDFEMPIFSIDRERGIPQKAHDFRAHISACDGIFISFTEHNGTYSAAFKNILDWVSRIDGFVWQGKPLFCLLPRLADVLRKQPEKSLRINFD